MMLLSLQDFLTQFLRERVDAEFLTTWLIATAAYLVPGLLVTYIVSAFLLSIPITMSGYPTILSK